LRLLSQGVSGEKQAERKQKKRTYHQYCIYREGNMKF
jgi:hypothetical protein